MSSQLKVLFNYKNTNGTEFIHIKDKRIPIFNIEESINKALKLEFIEKFMRLHHNYIDDTSLVFLANYIFHETNDFKDYNDFSQNLYMKFSSFYDLKVVASEYNNSLLRQINAIDENNNIIFKLLSKDNDSIYILIEKVDDNPVSSEALLQELYSKNVSVLQKFSPKEKDVYCRAENLIDTDENVCKLNVIERAIAVLMVCYPMYINVIKKEIVKKNLMKETTVSRIYHENSKMRTFHQQGDFMLPLDKIDDEVKKLTAQGRKKYPKHYKKIKLPSADHSIRHTLEEVILNRRSRRYYSNASVSIQKLSNILYYTYGITGKLEKTDLLLRAVPSGGGLYPIDIYISVNRVEGLEKGIYYYDSLEHALIFVNNNDLSKTSKEVSGYAAMLDTAAFTFILGANFWRNQWKYHERGYRVILIDCGHVAQNLHMMATAYDLGSCCLMGFVDDELNKILELDGIVEHSMYLITVGVNREDIS